MTSAASFSEATLKRFAFEVAKYPGDQAQSAVMACLAIVQQEQGYVSAESELQVAAYLGMPPIAVHEVTTFYNMYNQRPLGQFKLNVCTNLPCQLRNGETALAYLRERLKIEEGGTTVDGRITLQKSECLGACADAPVLLVNDRQMCSYMTHDRLDDLIELLQTQPVAHPAPRPAAQPSHQGKTHA